LPWVRTTFCSAGQGDLGPRLELPPEYRRRASQDPLGASCPPGAEAAAAVKGLGGRTATPGACVNRRAPSGLWAIQEEDLEGSRKPTQAVPRLPRVANGSPPTTPAAHARWALIGLGGVVRSRWGRLSPRPWGQQRMTPQEGNHLQAAVPTPHRREHVPGLASKGPAELLLEALLEAAGDGEELPAD
jgi:hypothetical protein